MGQAWQSWQAASKGAASVRSNPSPSQDLQGTCSRTRTGLLKQHKRQTQWMALRKPAQSDAVQ